jgi:hypothetical protein
MDNKQKILLKDIYILKDQVKNGKVIVIHCFGTIGKYAKRKKNVILGYDQLWI